MHAGTAEDALGRGVHAGLGAGYALGVVAPQTGQRASFEEKCNPDARSVVNRVPLDVEYPVLVGAEVIEVIAVAGHADHQVAVLLRMLLSIAESGGVHDVELDVVAAEAEVGADELAELGEVLLVRSSSFLSI